MQIGLSDSWQLFRRVLYNALVRGVRTQYLDQRAQCDEEGGHLLWPWPPRMRCLNNDEASLTKLIMQITHCVGKKLFAERLAILPECVRCGDMEESIKHAFFHYSVVRLLCKLLEGYMVCILNGRFFILEASSVCSNMVLSLKNRNTMCLLTWRFESCDLDDTTEGIP